MKISIHALLAESDRLPTALRTPHHRFLSTLSLRRATFSRLLIHHLSKFLSTLSLRRATRAENHANSQQEFLSTLSLRRATADRYGMGIIRQISIHALLAESDLTPARILSRLLEISIHALLAESDFRGWTLNINGPIFLSTLSLRRATHYDNYNLHCVEISIHALLAESDIINSLMV